ncbi:hypothetical protein Nepgr_030419 [Nepenthes gracilis]|uniref:Sodium/calcium exchanger membrane region domain-containing protein n=1 Tax=Nepenthes gracilis TaxID=150966 RepID=A0AAD3Y6J1_NEPGR|nr:hypothetical protein Nepgr_030419 [Nepenthes gracilis]
MDDFRNPFGVPEVDDIQYHELEVGEPNSMNPSSDPRAKGELGMDKLEVSNEGSSLNEEPKMENILDRFAPVAQKLMGLKDSVQELRAKLGTIKKRKIVKDVEHGKLRDRLQDIKNFVTQLLGLYTEPRKTIEDHPPSTSDAVRSLELNEIGIVQRKEVLNKALERLLRFCMSSLKMLSFSLQPTHASERSTAILAHENCERYFLFRAETSLGDGWRAVLYLIGLAYCFIGLSAITARFFRSMETVVKHARKVVMIDPLTNVQTIKYDKVWNYTIADITLLAFGTSFPQISLAIIDAIRNLGSLYAGGLGPGTLVGSAAFDLFPIHAVCVVVPKAGELKKISDIGVWLVELFWSFWAYVWLYIVLKVWTPDVVTLWESLFTVLQFGLLLVHVYAQDKFWPYLSLPLARSERPLEWVPEEALPCKHEKFNQHSEICQISDQKDKDVVDIFSIHSTIETGSVHEAMPIDEVTESSAKNLHRKDSLEDPHFLLLWKQQFMDALMLESMESKSLENIYLRVARISWQFLLLPWRFMFAFVPPYHIAHGWIAFICSLLFISGIAYVVTILTDRISCVTGINAYVIALTALASGTSWPDLVASKIAAERQTTADSAIANIICSNSVNIYVGIGIPWLIDTAYNFIAYQKPLYVQNAGALSFSLLVFFATSAGCIGVLVLRRLTLGAELGGPRIWAWTTCAYLLLLWLIFVILSSLKASGVI